jgi:hypothetical protein
VLNHAPPTSLHSTSQPAFAPPPPVPTPQDTAIAAALDALRLGFPGDAFTALQAASSSSSSFQSIGVEAEQVDTLCGRTYIVKTYLQKTQWNAALKELTVVERGWKGMGRETPWEGVRWKLQALEGAGKWKEVGEVAACVSSPSFFVRSSSFDLLLLSGRAVINSFAALRTRKPCSFTPRRALTTSGTSRLRRSRSRGC